MIPNELRFTYLSRPEKSDVSAPLPGSKTEDKLNAWRKNQFKKGIKQWIATNIPPE